MDDVSQTLARILDRTGDYRILRRVPQPPPPTMTDAERDAAGLAIGIVLAGPSTKATERSTTASRFCTSRSCRSRSKSPDLSW